MAERVRRWTAGKVWAGEVLLRVKHSREVAGKALEAVWFWGSAPWLAGRVYEWRVRVSAREGEWMGAE